MPSNMKQELAHSGWVKVASVAETLAEASLPIPDVDYLDEAFDSAAWDAADAASQALTEHFRQARFAATTSFGPLLVPDPSRLDTRGVLPDAARRDQGEAVEPDVVDARLPAGVDACQAGADWTLFVAATSDAGLAMGSWDDVREAEAEAFVVDGFDTRGLMIRQLWGALTLQCGEVMPDCELRERWTFTLFAGEESVAGAAVSGTVLHGRVRQRLGKTTRGIASARVRPALPIAASRSVAAR
ncbi:MAG: hypothetical protein Q3979_05345 [Actinomycetaceae bacterium]|nr:hypothetical protein [Actinomycetaceae bacterium]